MYGAYQASSLLDMSVSCMLLQIKTCKSCRKIRSVNKDVRLKLKFDSSIKNVDLSRIPMCSPKFHHKTYRDTIYDVATILRMLKHNCNMTAFFLNRSFGIYAKRVIVFVSSISVTPRNKCRSDGATVISGRACAWRTLGHATIVFIVSRLAPSTSTFL